jgi:hypothetical protein
MVYYQSKPIRISYKIQSLTQTRIRVSFQPLKIGTYRIYLAYRNFPINGKYDLLYREKKNLTEKSGEILFLIEMLKKKRKMCCQK